MKPEEEGIEDSANAATVVGQRRADFSDLVGQWTPDPAFDEILAAQRPSNGRTEPET
ncbi:MAG: hypothetical protein ABSF98_06075 [Bryobacteraceae bacterium]|jgi:hypothetical protein